MKESAYLAESDASPQTEGNKRLHFKSTAIKRSLAVCGLVWLIFFSAALLHFLPLCSDCQNNITF